MYSFIRNLKVADGCHINEFLNAHVLLLCEEQCMYVGATGADVGRNEWPPFWVGNHSRGMLHDNRAQLN